MTAIVVTCEHASGRVPARYRSLFAGRERLLESHRGYDKGALPLARAVAQAFGADTAFGRTSRLLVDLNRSPGHASFHSSLSRSLSLEERDAIFERYYRPFRESVERQIAWHLAAGRDVLHLSVHSFTPVLCGKRRNADIGLLYDPARGDEREFALELGRALSARSMLVRRNYPYRGTADGHTTALRRVFKERYVGLELELNQRLTADAPFARVRRDIVAALRDVLDLGD